LTGHEVDEDGSWVKNLLTLDDGRLVSVATDGKLKVWA
jgi:hypothetical protein